MQTRIGVDTGGTFTDFVAVRGGRIEVFKKFSTPASPEASILDGLKGLDPAEVIHGSTVATNALLERKGARVARNGAMSRIMPRDSAAPAPVQLAMTTTTIVPQVVRRMFATGYAGA